MTDVRPTGTERRREVARLVISVEDPTGDFSSRVQQARVRAVVEAVALAIFEDALGRLIDRLPPDAEAHRQAVVRLLRGESVGLRMLPFLSLPVRLDRATAALVGVVDLRIVEPLAFSLPLAAGLELHEGSIKAAAALALGLLSGAILAPAIEDSKPGALAKAYVREAIDAGWEAAGDAVETARRALEEMDLDGEVHREGDHLVIVLRRREDDDLRPPGERDPDRRR